MKNAILCDFDGTLVNDRGKIDKEGITLLSELLNNGNKLCIVSSSQYSALLNFIDNYKLDCDIFSLSSGMALINKKAVMNTLPKALINSLLNKYSTSIYTAYTETLSASYIVNYEERLDSLYPKPNRKIVAQIPEDIPSIMISILNDRANYFLEELASLRIDYKVIASDKNKSLIHVYRNTISKLDAYYLIKNAYPDYRTIGISDSYYDFDMITKCDIKIAMINSDEELKKHADIITEFDNNSSGALKTLYNICHLK